MATVWSVVQRGLPWGRAEASSPGLAALRAAAEEALPGAILHRDGDLAALVVDGVAIGLPLQRLVWLQEHRPERVVHEVHHLLAEARRCLRREEGPGELDRGELLAQVRPVLVPHQRVERADGYRALAFRLTPEIDVSFEVEAGTGWRVTAAQAEDLSLRPRELAEAAFRSWRARLGQASTLEVDASEAPVVRVRARGMRASELAHRGLVSQALPQHDVSQVLVALPTLEELLVLVDTAPSSVERLSSRALELWVESSAHLSPRVYRFEGERLEPWQTHA